VREREVLGRDHGRVVDGEHADARLFERGLNVAVGADLARVVAHGPSDRARANPAGERTQRRGGRPAPDDQPAATGPQGGVQGGDGRAKVIRPPWRRAQSRRARRIEDEHGHDLAEPRGVGQPQMIVHTQIARKREDRLQRAAGWSVIDRGSARLRRPSSAEPPGGPASREAHNLAHVRGER